MPLRHEQPSSPRKNASWISQLFFVWLVPLFNKGFKRTLELEDVYHVLPEDESRTLGDQLEQAWNEEITLSEIRPNYEPSLTKALVKVFGSAYAAYGIYAFYEECIVKLAQPVCLGLLLRYFQDPTKYEPYTGFILAGSVVLLSIIYTSSDHPFTFAVQHLGMKMRISLCSLLYRKALKMSKSAVEETTAGQIVNFLSSDMNRFDVLLTFLHYIWVAPVQLFLVIGVMYFYLEIGWPCLAGIGLLIVFVPFQGIMGHIFSQLRFETATKTDRRLVLMDEILSAMRVIKMYAWESIFISTVETARKEEVKALKKTAYCKSLNQSMFYVTSRITLFLTLLAYVLVGNRLSSEIVFVSLALYNSVQLVMTLFFPAAIASLAETLVAVKRFQDFLLLDEYKKPYTPIETPQNEQEEDYYGNPESSFLQQNQGFQKKKKKKNLQFTESNLNKSLDPNLGIFMRNLTAQWNPQSKDMAFNDISLQVKSGQIIGLIGPVGSGKGSIIQSILYELPFLKGTLEVRGTIGYASQEPWIFHGTIRENILFGKEFNPNWYEEVIDACALTIDLSLLPYSDHTLVGDRGTSLSGGQKARINLARAVYADADIYLLDDPLSAVDAEVGRRIVNKCILGLLKNKARILITHQLQYLASMDEIILVIDGWSTFRGRYSELVKSGIPFTEILTRYQLASPKASHQPIVGTVGSNVHLFLSHHASSATLLLENPIGKINLQQDIYSEDVGSLLVGAKNIGGGGHAGDRVVVFGQSNGGKGQEEIEEIGTGSLEWKLYWNYMTAGSSCWAVVGVILIALGTQVCFTCSDLWIQFWIESEEKNGKTKNNTSIKSKLQTDRDLQIGVYSGIILLLFILCLVRSMNFWRFCMQSSTELYGKLFYAVVRSPMSFFENNPMGRILNRFSKDVGVLDETLPPVVFDTLEIFLQTLGVIFIVSSSSPIMLFPTTIMAIAFYCIRTFYFRSARAIKRLEGVARSPVFSHVSTTLYGSTTIRAFRAEALFQRQFEQYLDIHSSVWYLFLASSRWLGIVVDWISILFVSSVLINFLLDEKGDAVVGLGLTSAMMLTSMLQWGIRQSAELSNQMISVERIIDYCNLEPEASLESSVESRPPPDWPMNGEIKIRNLSLQIVPDSDSYILKDINCTIKGGEKIGVVGRTGAGKSSLLSVLFRIAEPTEGFIEIDGIITSSIGLHDLRSRISIIPQEPVLFQGTIRINLDPFAEYTDDMIWDVLKDVHLDGAVKDLPQGLYALIAEGGTNFSTGQKQLFCLARAILRSNQILVLDEATANVDPETDGLIQKTLRTNFADCTVITIAHRLHTVMDSDRILVLDAGQIVEFDEPEKLLGDRSSALYSLAQQTGKAEAANLLRMARLMGTRRKRTFIPEEE